MRFTVEYGREDDGRWLAKARPCKPTFLHHRRER